MKKLIVLSMALIMSSQVGMQKAEALTLHDIPLEMKIANLELQDRKLRELEEFIKDQSKKKDFAVIIGISTAVVSGVMIASGIGALETAKVERRALIRGGKAIVDFVAGDGSRVARAEDKIVRTGTFLAVEPFKISAWLNIAAGVVVFPIGEQYSANWYYLHDDTIAYLAQVLEDTIEIDKAVIATYKSQLSVK